MNTPKTIKQIISELTERGITVTEISKLVDYHFSAIAKVARGDQDSLPYEVGKRIEQLEAKTRRRKANGK